MACASFADLKTHGGASPESKIAAALDFKWVLHSNVSPGICSACPQEIPDQVGEEQITPKTSVLHPQFLISENKIGHYIIKS